MCFLSTTANRNYANQLCTNQTAPQCHGLHIIFFIQNVIVSSTVNDFFVCQMNEMKNAKKKEEVREIRMIETEREIN